MEGSRSAVRIDNALTEPFNTERGSKQSDSLSCDFFKIIMMQIICAATQKHNVIIFYKIVMAFAYADDIDIIGRSKQKVWLAFSKFVGEAQKVPKKSKKST